MVTEVGALDSGGDSVRGEKTPWIWVLEKPPTRENRSTLRGGRPNSSSDKKGPSGEWAQDGKSLRATSTKG